MEAHVMNYDEIVKAAENKNVVWEELRSDEKIRPLCFNGTDFVGLSYEYYLLLCECDEEICEDYNWNYRLWNNLPSSLQRKETKWKEDPYVEK